MGFAHRRYDISNEIWAKVGNLLSGQTGKWGGKEEIIAGLSVLFFGLLELALCGEICLLTTETGRIHRRFCRWRDKGVWGNILQQLISDQAYEWLMIDSIFTKAYHHTVGARGSNQKMSRTKGRLIERYLAVDAHNMPLRMVVTEGCCADCTEDSKSYSKYSS